MSEEFAAFTEAVTAASTVSDPTAVAALSRVAVLGGGADARLIAALCLAAEAEVTLFSAYGTELELLRSSSGISLRGAGPVGTYQADREGVPSVQTTAELDRAVSGAEVIFLSGPIHKQRTYAMVLASHLSDGQILVMAPGRSLGALETAWFLRIGVESFRSQLCSGCYVAKWQTSRTATAGAIFTQYFTCRKRPVVRVC